MVTNYQDAENETVLTTYLITPDGETLLEEVAISAMDQPPGLYLNYSFIDVAGDYFVRSSYTENTPGRTLRSTECPTGDCPELALPGWLTIAPDNQHALAAAFDADGTLVPAELQAEISIVSLLKRTVEPVGRGGHPFWLNAATYGYWQMGETGLEMVTAVLAQNDLYVLLTEATLLENMPR